MSTTVTPPGESDRFSVADATPPSGTSKKTLVEQSDSPSTSNYKATFYSVKGTNGDQTWRVESPARAIGAKVNYIPDGHEGGSALYWPNKSSFFPWSLNLEFEDGSREIVQSREAWEALCEQRKVVTDRSVSYPNQEGDAAVFTRPLAFGASHVIGLKQEGVRVTCEVDDNYLAKHHLNYFMQKANQELAAEGKKWEDYVDDHARSICAGDGILVSTDHLRDVYWKELTARFGKKHLPEIHVCRNFVDEQFVPKELVEPREDGKLRIGYMGSDSHLWDIDLIYAACVEAFINGHEIVFIGIDPANINPKYRRSKNNWSAIDYTHIPWTNNFRGVALPLDIGFAPLIVDEHTLCKSDIKALEYALSGAACIAQNCLVYNRTLADEQVLFAGGPTEYVHQMRRLIKDEELRRSLVEGTRQYIADERMLMDNADEWKAAVLG